LAYLDEPFGTIKICLNAHGTEPSHLAGRCWGGQSTPACTLAQPQAGRNPWAESVHDKAFCDPGYGALVRAMQEGHADSLLVRAARHGRTKTMRLLIEMHANVDQVSGYGESPLFAACMQSEIGAVCILHEAGASLSFVHEMTDFTLLGVAVRDLDERRRESYRWGAAHLRPRLYTAAAKREAQLAVVRYLLETASIASVEMELCAHEPTRNPLFQLLCERAPPGLGTSTRRREVVQLLDLT